MCRDNYNIGWKADNGPGQSQIRGVFDAVGLHKLDVSICLMLSVCISCTKSRGKFLWNRLACSTEYVEVQRCDIL